MTLHPWQLLALVIVPAAFGYWRGTVDMQEWMQTFSEPARRERDRLFSRTDNGRQGQ